MKITQKTAALLSLSLLAACSADDDKSTSGTVNLSIGATTEASLRLMTADTVSIGDNIVLSYAKFNIAKIKIKAAKEQSEEEAKLEKEEGEKEAVAEDNFEKAVGEDEMSAELMKKDPAAAKSGRQTAVKEKRNDLAKAEKEQLEGEVKADESTKFSGPFVFDAIKGAVEGEAVAADVSEGSYSRIEFQLKRNLSATDDEAILGNVFAIKGTYTKDGSSTPFEIDWHAALNFRLTGDSAFTVSAGENSTMIIDFAIDRWFENIDLSQATVDANGTIYINKNTNQAIMKELRRNIRESTGFGRDMDGDKSLNKEERKGKGQDTEATAS